MFKSATTIFVLQFSASGGEEAGYFVCETTACKADPRSTVPPEPQSMLVVKISDTSLLGKCGFESRL